MRARLTKLASFSSFFKKRSVETKLPEDKFRVEAISLSKALQLDSYSPTEVPLKVIELDDILKKLVHYHWQKLAAVSEMDAETKQLLNIYNKYFNGNHEAAEEIAELDIEHPLSAPSYDILAYDRFIKAKNAYLEKVSQFILVFKAGLERLAESNNDQVQSSVSGLLGTLNSKENILLNFHLLSTTISSIVNHFPKNEETNAFRKLCEEQQKVISEISFTHKKQTSDAEPTFAVYKITL